MNRRNLFALMLLGILLAAPALGADEEPREARAASATETKDSPPPVQASALDQGTIFRILCGGAPTPDAALSSHLWQMAGTLADSAWTPPRVTLRVVVSDPAIR